MLQICANIKQARSLTDKTQKDMADLLGVKRTTYANWETTTQPDLDTLKRISQILGVDFSQLLSERTPIEDKDVQSRLLRIEAHLEVFQISIAALKSKKPEDFDQRYSELQSLIAEAVRRRKDQP